mgnify:CR=1 FL=1
MDQGLRLIILIIGVVILFMILSRNKGVVKHIQGQTDNIYTMRGGNAPVNTTEVPVTAAPVVVSPAPVTQAPVTQVAVTKAPETKAPETKAPVTQAPATKAPVTQAPSISGFSTNSYASVNVNETAKTAADSMAHVQNSQNVELNAADLLPKDVGNLLVAPRNLGINTVGNSLRNANLQIRSEPPNPRQQVSPWLQATIDPDLTRRQLDCN